MIMIRMAIIIVPPIVGQAQLNKLIEHQVQVIDGLGKVKIKRVVVRKKKMWG